jgi:RHS repeat-associated protein
MSPGSTVLLASLLAAGSVRSASRVSKLAISSVNVARYRYLGAGTTVGIDYAEAAVYQRRYGTTSGSSPDLDRVGRQCSHHSNLFGHVDAAGHALQGVWGTNSPKCDLNLDGTINATDQSTQLGNIGVSSGFAELTRNRNRLGYAGYAADSESAERWHVRHRTLESKLGRWTKRDPLGYIDGENVVEYARSAPLTYFDPTGLCPGFCCPACDVGETCVCDFGSGDCACVADGGPGGGGPCKDHGAYNFAMGYCGPNDGIGVWLPGFVIPPFNSPFNACCFHHDNCFAACKQKRICDSYFLSCLLVSCAPFSVVPATFRMCLIQASIFYTIVSSVDGAYCACCPHVVDPCNPPPHVPPKYFFPFPGDPIVWPTMVLPQMLLLSD